MSCRNRGCGCGGNQGNRGGSGSGCRRTGCFTATVPVTVTYQITPNFYDERAIIDQIPSNTAFNNAGDYDDNNWSDSSYGCGCD